MKLKPVLSSKEYGLKGLYFLGSVNNIDSSCRLFDAKSFTFKDIPEIEVKRKIYQSKTKKFKKQDNTKSLEEIESPIVNLDLNSKGELVGTNGAISRYGVISPKEGKQVSVPVILMRIDKQSGEPDFIITGLDGKVYKISTADLIELGTNVGLSNGMIKNNKEISSIKGSYPTIEEKASQKVEKVVKPVVEKKEEKEELPKFLDGLNEQQLEAVLTTEGNIRLIAGAGTGKTNTLTKRIAYLVHKGINPSEILSLTFTNKAAAEMKERAANLLGVSEDILQMKTFHSLCLDILKEDIGLMGWESTFSIGAEDIPAVLLNDYIIDKYGKQLTDKELKTLSKELSKDMGKIRRLSVSDTDKITNNNYMDYISSGGTKEDISDIDGRELLNLIEERKKLEKDNTFMVWNNSKSPMERLVSNIFEYQKNSTYLQFDDVIKIVCYLLTSNPDVLAKWQDRFKYIQVDEFQDTDDIQFEIVRLLSEKSGNLFVVGDPDQSIYEFRQAKPEILVHLDKKLPNVKTIIMDMNYRSSEEIIAVSNEVIKGYIDRIDKNLVSKKGKLGQKPKVIYTPSVEESVSEMLEIIKGKIQSGVKPNDIAILYEKSTSPYYKELVGEQLDNSGIKYRLFVNSDLTSYSEYQFALAVLRLANNKNDILGWTNVLKGLAGLNDADGIAQSMRIANMQGTAPIDFIDDSLSLGAIDMLNKSKLERILGWVNDVSRLSSISSLLDKLKGLLEFVFNSDSNKASQMVIKEVMKVATKSFNGGSLTKENITEGVSNFVNNASGEDLDTNDYVDCIQIMTIHKSKGLEFNNVFCLDVNYGMFPNAVSDEGYRLAYVAFTRAKENLYVLTDSSDKVTGRGKNVVKVEKGPSHYITLADKSLWDLTPECESKWDFFTTRNEDYIKGKKEDYKVRKEERDDLYKNRVYKVMDED